MQDDTLSFESEKDQKIEKLTKQNANLLRIMKERANQDRGITPKKTHDGYVVLSSRQCTEHFTRDMTEAEYNNKDIFFRQNHIYSEEVKPTVTDTAICWQTTIQTPIDAGMPYDDIKDEIIDELCNGGVLLHLGCDRFIDQDLIVGHYIHDSEDGNEIYRIRFRANFRSKFWEVDVFSTDPLIVSDVFRKANDSN